MKKPAVFVFFLFLVSVLTLRLFSDHSQNFHYTGDFHAEQSVLDSAKNFEKLGLWKTRFLPTFKEVRDPSMETTESLRPYMYYHYPPLSWWLFGGVYVLSGHSERTCRLLALAVSLLGLVFAMKAVRTFQLLSQPPAEREKTSFPFLIILAVLVLNPSFLLFADTIQQLALIEALQWASLFWLLRYRFGNGSLKWGIVLYFLHVWLTFEWLVPFLLIIIIVLFQKEGSPLKNPKPWLLFFAFGFFLPILLRLFHNAWALGGFQNAMHDLIARAQTRSLGDPAVAEMHYSVVKHLGKLFFGLPWFVGLTPFLLIALQLPLLRERARKNKKLFQLLGLWGLGSVSWQFLMPQSAMAHPFSQMHIANFIFLVAAIGIALFWEKKQNVWLPLLLLYCVEAGMVIKTEIIFPFLSQSTRVLASQVCPAKRGEMIAKLAPIKSSVSEWIQKELGQVRSSPACGAKNTLASKVLMGYVFGVKSRLEPPK